MNTLTLLKQNLDILFLCEKGTKHFFCTLMLIYVNISTKIINQQYCGVKMLEPKNQMSGTVIPPYADKC